jgi:hypothetical protein
MAAVVGDYSMYEVTALGAYRSLGRINNTSTRGNQLLFEVVLHNPNLSISAFLLTRFQLDISFFTLPHAS